MLWAFLPIAVVVTVTPGAATAMVVRSAMRGGVRAGWLTIAGNSVGVVAWALLSVAGISALVAASEVAFVGLKITGAVTSVANPKLAVFFIALFPQFVGERGDVLPTTLVMAAMIVCGDLVWYGVLAYLASRAKTGFMRSRAGRWLERTTGAVLIALGVRVALTGDARL